MTAGRADKFWTLPSPIPSGMWHGLRLAGREHRGAECRLGSCGRTSLGTDLSSDRRLDSLQRAKANRSLLKDASHGEEGEHGETRE